MYSNDISSNSPKKNFALKLALILGVVAISLSVIFVVYVRYIKDSNDARTGATPVSYTKAVELGKEKAVDTPIVTLTLSIKPSEASDVSITEIKGYTNGTPKTSGLTSGAYQVVIIKDGKQVYIDYFNQPEKILSETVDSDTGEFKNAKQSSPDTLVLTLPWFDGASILYIKDSKGNVILKKSLSDTPLIKNTPDYKIYQ